MSKPTTFGKILRITALILFGLTVVFSLLGGIGSSCVALGAEKYTSMVALVPFKWLYQILVVLTIGASLYGIKALFDLVKRREGAFREAFIALIACLVLALVQVIASRILRGKSMPNDMRVYIGVVTVIVFLLLRLPGVWNQAGMELPGGHSGALAAGLSLFMCGVTILTVHLWVGTTHTWEGVNFADVWHTQLAVLGWGLVVGSLLPFIKVVSGQIVDSEESESDRRTRVAVG